jgi:hypothetical protein
MLEQSRRMLSACSAFCALLAITGCGGGGGDAPAPAPAAASVSGVATTQTALASRPVTAKCTGGSVTTTTGADGAYTVPLGGASFPCALQVTLADGTALHSLAVGSGAVRANVTPLTDLVVASLAGQAPASYFSGFDTAAAAQLTSAQVSSAVTAVQQVLADAGIGAVSDPLAGALTAGGTSGYGQVLKTLANAMATSGTSQAQLIATTAASSTVTASAMSGTPSLPAAQLLKPGAATCSALRSGRYRVVAPYFAPTASQTEVIDIDASALTVHHVDGEVDTFTAQGACRFVDAADPAATDMVVSPAGVIAGRYRADDATYRLFIAFPEQVHTVAELAGDWNSISTEQSGGTSAATALYHVASGSSTLSATGAVTAFSFCDDVVHCIPLTGQSIAVSTNAAGGFDLVNSTGDWTDRYFAYRSGGGELMLVGFAGDGTIAFLTHQRSDVPPAVGSTTDRWNLWMNASAVASAPIAESHFTTVSSDAPAGSWVRQRVDDGHLETLVGNLPRAGYTFRAAAAATGTSGPVTINEFTALGLRGSGLSVLWLPALGPASTPGALMLSVTQP